MRRLLSLVVIAALSAGCAASAGEDVGKADDALTSRTLTAAACRAPTVHTSAMTEGGEAVEGSSVSSITGCIVGKPGETGRAVTDRLTALLGDTTSIGSVKGADDKPVFKKFTPGATSGTLATGLMQDVDVTLALFGSPSARLRITRRLAADGTYSLRITNITPFRATVAFVPVTAITPENLSLEFQTKPEANGLGVTGTGAVELEIMKDQAPAAAGLVRDLFVWVTGELAG